VGKKDKALESFGEALKCKNIQNASIRMIRYRNSLLFENIHNEPRFLDFMKRMEEMSLPDRKRIDKMLEDEGIRVK